MAYHNANKLNNTHIKGQRRIDAHSLVDSVSLCSRDVVNTSFANDLFVNSSV